MSEHAAPPMRHYLPTLPCDLTEYARIHTGPSSWSAHADDLRDVLTEPDAMCTFLDDEPLSSVIDGPLMGVRRSDVPRATCAASYVEPVLDDRERRALSLVDGSSSLGEILGQAELAEADVLAALCNLTLRGVVEFTSRHGSVRELEAE